jgi:ATPase subunit of ABC transporter with duplicated ATPase domains
MDAAGTESKARIMLLGLGFPAESLEKPFTSLSGGWRTRCNLACALIQQVDILLLDEPTNFLDLPAVIWLQHYITTNLVKTSVVVVTHDHDFADAVGDELILLRTIPAKTLETFKGNLSAYERERSQQILRMTRMKEAQDKKTKHMEHTITSNLRAAKRTGDDKKLKQAASRKKKLEERTGMEVGLKGGRFKLNRDLAGYHLTNRADIEIPALDPPVSLTLPYAPSPLRFPGPLFSIENVTFRYRGAAADTLKDINLVLHPGERAGIAGLNGAGKSTLIQLLMSGEDGAMRPVRGTIARHPRARFAVFSQHAVEALEELGQADGTRTALVDLLDTAAGELAEQDARAILGDLGLKGKVASDVPLRALSGGQRVRLALAKATFNSPHLLILDEVTTHLDIDTVVALAEALESWEGALLVVTHDRFFMKVVVEGEEIDDESDEEEERRHVKKQEGVVYRLRNGSLGALNGGMSGYEELMEKSIAKLKIA